MSIKKLILVLCMISPAAIQAQEVVLEGITGRGYSGVKSMEGKAYYTCYFGEKTETKGMANFMVELFDKDLQKINTTAIELTKGSELAGSCFNGDYFLFVFVDWGKKTISMVTLNEQGKIEEKKIIEDVKRSLLEPDNYTNIMAAEGDFVLVKPVKEKKFGFVVERMDEKLNVAWSKEFTDEKKAIRPMVVKSNGEKIFIISQEKPNMSAKKFDDFVICIDASKGDEEYKYPLNDGESTGWPTSLVIDDKGNVITSGMYFNGGSFDDANSDGLFFLALDQTGKKTGYSKTPWKTVIGKIKDQGSGLLLGGKTKVMVEDIVWKKDGSYVVIAETFRKGSDKLTGNVGMKMVTGGGSSSSSTEEKVGFTIMDFVFFNFDAQGQLGDIKKVNKEPREIIITGKLASESGLEIAMQMREYGFFCYQYTIEHKNKQYIVFKNWDGFKTKAYFMELGAESTENLPFIDMNKEIGEKLNKTAKTLGQISGNTATEFNSDGDAFSRGGGEKYKGILTAKDGHMLMYDFIKQKLHIWLVKIPVT